MSSYLDQLNPTQKEAVINTEGPLMIIAGAGSGKTRVLTYRIAHLIQLGVSPFHILALTFTNKAAKEMKERIAQVVGVSESRSIWMGTFHSVFARILRLEADKLGYPKSFTIFDTEDAKKVISRIVKHKQLDKDYYKPNVLYSRISSLKNNLITYKNYQSVPELLEEDRYAKRPQFHEIYTLYCEECFRQGAMDFDDLLLKTNELFHKFPQVLSKYQQQFQYLLVDEYQDTNHSQYLIIKALAALFENICVVGDDAQSIYAFRGANIKNILNFSKDYPDLKQIKLEQNYRSTQVIVSAANSVIAHNKDQIDKSVWTQNDQGDKIPVFANQSEGEEAQRVVSTLWDLKQQEGLSYSSFAIMYRTNAQSRLFEESFRKKNIPYKIYGGLSFYQRKEIKDVLSYFRVVINAKDDEATRRIVNYPPRKIGQTTQNKLNIYAVENGLSWMEAIEAMRSGASIVGGAAEASLQRFALAIQAMRAESKQKNAYEVGEYIVKTSGIIAHLKKEEHMAENIARIENIDELLNAMRSFCEDEENEDISLEGFLSTVALLTDADKQDENEDHVSIMTVHQSKGLEYPYVFVVGLEEQLFPSQNALFTREDLEEERRLFYVAITRAEKKVFLSYAQSRFRWGNLHHNEVSRFISEIDPKFLELPSLQRGTNTPQQLSKEPSLSASAKGFRKLPPMKAVPKSKAHRITETLLTDFRVGMMVGHHRFGVGEIQDITPEGNQNKLRVRFLSGEIKTLLSRYAKLTKVEKKE